MKQNVKCQCKGRKWYQPTDRELNIFALGWFLAILSLALFELFTGAICIV